MKHTASPQSQNKMQRRQFLLVLLALVLIAGAGVSLFLKFYVSYIDKTLYAERLSQMREVTIELFSSIEDVIDSQWTVAETQSRYLMDEQPQDVDALISMMERQSRLNTFEQSRSEMVAVDSTGRYYTQYGMQGTLAGLDYLADNPQRVSYVYTPMTSDNSEMVFLLKLEEPIPIQVGTQTVTLTYYGVSRSMAELNPYFACAAYDGNNSVYVLDSNGSKLFSDIQNDLLHGHNLYDVLDQMSYLHGTSFSEAKSELSQHNIAYSNAVLSGEEYYYALYRMENAEWTLLFLVPSAYVATNTVALINTTMRLILLMSLALVMLCALAIYVIMWRNQKRVLAAEHRNNQALKAINQELDSKNAMLSAAVAAAEDASQSARAANAAKSDFLANMSHDIRTPMNAIVGLTNLMEHDMDDPEKLAVYIHKIQISSQHLLGLINDVLDMSKIESSEVSLSQEPVSLAEQVGQVDSIIRPQAEERHQSFTIRVHEIAHEYLIGDAVHLRQVLINLLSNAVKYTPDGGSILFELSELPCGETDHATIRATVTDTGYGMTPQFMQHIFEPFTRAENSTTNKVQGTGLGMAITKSIVDLMNGTITVESQVGKGSCFEVTLTLPINRNAGYQVNANGVLLISNEDLLIRNATVCFRAANVLLKVARTKPQALELLQDRQLDTILLAGCLQDQNLEETIQLLRHKAKDAVLIFCCDYAQQEQVHHVVEHCGADGLIARPMFFSTFARLVNQAHSDVATPDNQKESVLHGMNFLCAEDNALNAEILSAILDMNHARCTIYPDGAALVEAFQSVKPGEYDAILMDVQMPVMNGLDATRAIRRGKNPLGKTIPIIAMTANAFSSDVQDCLAAGMDAHVAKPIDISVLERTLKEYVVHPAQAASK